MEIVQTWIAAGGKGRGTERGAMGAEMVAEYMERSARFCGCGREVFGDEAAFWAWAAGKARGRTVVALLDGRGQQMTSEGFAGWMGRLRDEGVRRMVLGVGPADGWSSGSRERADVLVSLGSMTLPHQLARVVLAEQVYRALTILAGHPYHCGH